MTTKEILPINTYSLSDFAQAVHEGTLKGYTLDHHSNDNACIQLGILFTCKMIKSVEDAVVKVAQDTSQSQADITTNPEAYVVTNDTATVLATEPTLEPAKQAAKQRKVKA
jgi:hypothetical protein